jgi:hypothetical protein
MDDWPFDQSPNCMCVSLRTIVFDGQPILYVSHDEDDHGWQFLGGGAVEMSNAALVALSTIVKLDASVLAVADLPPGWHAWRKSTDGAWQRAQSATGA